MIERWHDYSIAIEVLKDEIDGCKRICEAFPSNCKDEALRIEELKPAIKALEDAEYE